jgi:uncharacterized protein
VTHARLPADGVFACHHLETEDPGSAASFYQRLFGWTTREIRAAGSLGETTFRSDEVDVATAGGSAIPGAVWLPCFSAADPDSAAADAERLGALRRQPAAGVVEPAAVLADPVGALFAITGRATGCAHGIEAGAVGRICWTELVTGAPGPAAAFYREFCGWTCVERRGRHGGRYGVFWQGGREVAGMLHVPAGTRASCWVPYVQVASAEDTAALAQDLGGSLETSPRSVPGRGRYAVLRDPGGALFGVFASTEAA